MKKSIKSIIVSVFALALVFAFKNSTEIKELEIGAKTPMANIKMKDVTGTEVTLNDVKLENGLLVIFSCNTCPYVKLSESRIKELSVNAKKNKIGMILINSNEAQRDEEDSFDEMTKYAKAQAYDFSYVLDEKSAVADAFGATRTPHCFLFNNKGELVYRGAIDDNIKDASAAKEHYLNDAMNATSAGKTVKTNSTKSIGCSIKRVES